MSESRAQYATPKVALAVVFCTLAALAMWLGWPWVVGFMIFFLFLVFA